SARSHRQRELYDQRRRPSDAGQERTGAARFALFRSGPEMTRRRGAIMRYGNSIGAIVLAATLCTADAQAFDDAQYPDLKGQWIRISPPGQPAFDPSKPRGWSQQAPLTPEYQAVFAANLADLAAGGEGLWPGHGCRPPGMPAMMTGYEPLEIIVLPETTYILIDHIHDSH